jgi:hypothetical protein
MRPKGRQSGCRVLDNRHPEHARHRPHIERFTGPSPAQGHALILAARAFGFDGPARSFLELDAVDAKVRNDHLTNPRSS